MAIWQYGNSSLMVQNELFIQAKLDLYFQHQGDDIALERENNGFRKIHLHIPT